MTATTARATATDAGPVREHFSDPRTLTMPHLLFLARGRQPEQQK